MVRQDGAETRRLRIKDIGDSLKGIGKEGTSLNNFVAVQMLKTGLTKQKIMEYLGVLEGVGCIEVNKKTDTIRDVFKNE